jgi:TonB family protein
MSSKPDRFKGTDGMTIGQTVGGLRESNRECSVSGTVEDPSGARVPDAIVSLIGPAGGFNRTVATNRQGEFIIDRVPEGTYRVVVTHVGFERAESKVEVAGPAHKTSVRVMIGLGSVSEVMRVTAKKRVEVIRVTAKRPAEAIRSSEPPSTEEVREGGRVEPAKLIYVTHPQYPESARTKGIQGDVILRAVISVEGIPLALSVIRSPDPDLTEAAEKAVKQWRYEPTKLNGVPVEVVTDITVQFALEN